MGTEKNYFRVHPWIRCRKLSQLDERGLVVPVLLVELLGLVDDDVALVVFADRVAVERALGRALGAGALAGEAAAVAGADDFILLDLHGAVLVRAGRGGGVELALVADDQHAV